MDRRVRWLVMGFCCALFLAGGPVLLVYADTQSPPCIWMKPLGTDEESLCVVPQERSDFPKNAIVEAIEIGLGGRAALVSIATETKEPNRRRTYWVSLREPYLLVCVD